MVHPYRRVPARAAAIAAAAAAALLAGCIGGGGEVRPQDAGGEDIFGAIATDRSRYDPGEPVRFTLRLNETGPPQGELLVRYRQLDAIVEEANIDVAGRDEVQWEWRPPKDDFTGYMAEVYFRAGSDVLDHVNIAVDVSSDWGKFPRYGYLADYMDMAPKEQEAVIERLNRFHINGIQFYDWQWKHHIPLRMENGRPAERWREIANRDVSLETVRRYIDLAHEKNMKAMNYNLLFGAYEDAANDGVRREWGMFKDPLATTQDKHPLPDSWASDIMLMDPSNDDWKRYLFEQERTVFEHLPFDGWHVDQLGDRGTLWNAASKKIDLGAAYLDFLRDAKQAIDVEYVFNAVGQFGQAYIAQAPVKFLYTEVWSGHPQYKHLKDIVDQNAKLSKGRLNTVLAAYMNYDRADSPGEFNAPGVLLTDAVMFASGASHLELGENMLAKEYFPNRNLSIPAALEERLIRYYDFLVAYQNVLRDSVEDLGREAAAIDGAELSSAAEQGKVWTFAKRKKDMDVHHFINFSDAVHMQWNDANATQTEPGTIADIRLSVPTRGKAVKVWTASPDRYEGSPIELDFKQEGDVLTVVLPELQYWNMLIIEYSS
ncbi:glycoside hydrolase family 66 protein [Paenibacillus sp.]|uniref:glycoside hydrolase family 66 protein n=1 Tax=Paenibacillus sp. TaxID=58172 RepID=UPI002D59AA83|nr:glycoside hydrolase family 66 protein [Paenibacillus sp.]HZG86300.1 glycoside hydrolase family 66 protein [Paenibacillus sp.]